LIAKNFDSNKPRKLKRKPRKQPLQRGATLAKKSGRALKNQQG